MFKHLFDTIKLIKPTYMANKNLKGFMPGTRAVSKMFIKNIGFVPSIFTGIGALGGTFGVPVVPGAGMVGAAGGYALGVGLEKGTKLIAKNLAKGVKKVLKLTA